jgi:hypothetical protein
MTSKNETRKALVIRSGVRAGACHCGNHNSTRTSKALVIRSGVRAGGYLNHNSTKIHLVRTR